MKMIGAAIFIGTWTAMLLVLMQDPVWKGRQ